MQLSMFYTLITSKRDQCLSSPAKIRVYQTLVLPVLLCACGAWTVLAAGAKRLEAFHMKCQRQIMMIRWREHVRNTGVASLTGLCPVLDLSTRCRNVVFGHIARLSGDTPAHQALRYHVDLSLGHLPDQGLRHRPGRPSNRWIDQVRRDNKSTTTYHQLICGGHPSCEVIRGWRYGPCRLRVNDDELATISWSIPCSI